MDMRSRLKRNTSTGAVRSVPLPKLSASKAEEIYFEITMSDAIHMTASERLLDEFVSDAENGTHIVYYHGPTGHASGYLMRAARKVSAKYGYDMVQKATQPAETVGRKWKYIIVKQ